jgi:mannosyl-oligosaccharide alpha-1,3-glucosidase
MESSLLVCSVIRLLWFCVWQVVALNSSQAAEGELYIDDGSSFGFLEGAFIHRRFIFANGKLTSVDLAPTSGGNVRHTSNVVIERIIVLGHAHGSKNALIEPSNQKVDIELGPLWVQRANSPAFMTIRKPNVRVAEDWTIKIL